MNTVLFSYDLCTWVFWKEKKQAVVINKWQRPASFFMCTLFRINVWKCMRERCLKSRKRKRIKHYETENSGDVTVINAVTGGSPKPYISVEEDQAGVYYGGDTGNVSAVWDGELEGNPVIFCTYMDNIEPMSGKKSVLEKDGTIHCTGLLCADRLWDTTWEYTQPSTIFIKERSWSDSLFYYKKKFRSYSVEDCCFRI